MSTNENVNTQNGDYTFSEAPASWNTRYIHPSGYECQITLRGETGTELLEKVQNAIEYLITEIVDIDLARGVETSLISKLDNALKSLEKDNDGAAINQLNAFINAVAAQGGKKITDADANSLIEMAQSIIDTITT